MEAKSLTALFKTYPDICRNRSRLQALLNDMFPTERLEIRLILSAQETGIADEIQRNDLDDFFVKRMARQLMDDYGLDQARAGQAVLLWCDAFGTGVLGKPCTASRQVAGNQMTGGSGMGSQMTGGTGMGSPGTGGPGMGGPFTVGTVNSVPPISWQGSGSTQTGRSGNGSAQTGWPGNGSQQAGQPGNYNSAANSSRPAFSQTGLQWGPDNTLYIAPPRRPKKITGTRLPDVLGMNPFKSPFETWCAITKTYEEPFAENKYTRAGKAIEPKQFEYAKREITSPGGRFVSPRDIYGPDYFSKTYGDFFSATDIFGGMWDYLIQLNGRTVSVLEMKTTNEKNAVYWRRSLPETNVLQAALYAWLLKADRFYMVSSFLSDQNYASPNSYVCDGSNTMIREFSLSNDFPHFGKNYIDPAREWWNRHVLTGISPRFDEARDEKILRALGYDPF